MRSVLPVAILAAAACAAAASASTGKKLPRDVAAFQERRATCKHFRGEDPYNEERRTFLIVQLKRHCDGSDAHLRQLRKRYSRDSSILRLLEDYEFID